MMTDCARLGVVSASAAFICIAGSAALLQAGLPYDQTADAAAADSRLLLAAFALLLGAALLGLALRWIRPAPGFRLSAAPLVSGRINRAAALAGIVLLALLAEINANRLGIGALQQVSYHVQMALLVGGVGLMTWGVSGSPHPLRPLSMQWRGGWGVRNRETLLVGSIMLLALLLNAWRVQEANRIYVDEYLFIDAYLKLIADPFKHILPPLIGYSSIVWTYPYLQSWGVALFGADFAGLRAPSVVMGALTIPAIYLLAKALYNRKLALVAALLLATFPPHIHFSRLGLYNIASPLFGTWALAFFARGLRDNRRADFALAGTMLGLTFYFYEGGRLFYTPLVVLWLGALVLIGLTTSHTVETKRASPLQTAMDSGWQIAGSRLRGLATSALTFGLAVAPLVYSWSSLGDQYDTRLRQIGGTRLPDTSHLGAYFADQLKPALLHFVHSWDSSRYFYAGNTPLVLVFVAPFFLFGIVYALWRLRSPGSSLLLLALALTVVGNSLLDVPDYTSRFVVAFPSIALLVAVGLVALWELVFARPLTPLPPLPRKRGEGKIKPLSHLRGRGVWDEGRLRRALAVVVVIALAGGQTVYYFHDHLPLYNVQARKPYDYIDAYYRMRTLPPGTTIYLITDETETVTWGLFDLMRRFWNRPDMDMTLMPVEGATKEFFARLSRNANYAFFMQQNTPEVFVLAAQMFPNGVTSFSPYNVPEAQQYVLYYAPKPAPTMTASASAP